MKRSHISSGTVGMLLMITALLAAAAAAASGLPAAEPDVTCSAYELAPCSGAIFGAGYPSAACCSKLREQQPCLCGYLRDPNLRSYVNSPNARAMAAVCRVPYPRC